MWPVLFIYLFFFLLQQALFTNKKLAVSNKITKDSVAVVYNFTVANYHTYYVSNLKVLVHNACYEPVKLPDGEKGAGQLNMAIKDIDAGGGVPRIDPSTGTQPFIRVVKTLNGLGALEYEVTVPGRMNDVRILKLQTGIDPSTGNPTYKFGYTIDHYRRIHEFKPIQPITPPSDPTLPSH